MYLTDADKNTELEAVTFAPGTCTDCGDDTHVYHDTDTGEYLCLDCLDEAVRDEAEQVNADEWDALYRMKRQEARQERLDAARASLPAPSDWPF